MLKTKSIFTGIILLISCLGCSQKENYFNGEITIVSDIPFTDTLVGEQVTLDSINSGILSLCDTLLFFWSPRTPDYHYRCFDLQGHYIADYLPKGRGADEFLSITPIIQKYKENGEWKALFTALNEKKTGIFNITKSIHEKKTICDTLFPSKWSKIFQYDNNHILAYKQAEIQDAKENKYTYPQWLMIDYRTGEINKTYDIFKKDMPIPGTEKLNDHLNSAFSLLNNDRTELVMFWEVIPQINILNLETGKWKGFRLAALPDFNDIARQENNLKQYYSFSDIDDRYIYALFINKDYFPSEENQDCTIHVFNREGQLVHKLYLEEGIDQIQVDAQNRILYGVNFQMEEIYRYRLPF